MRKTKGGYVENGD